MAYESINTRMEDFTSSGYWWLPEQTEDDSLGGTLTYSKKEGARLELLGTFRDMPALFKPHSSYPTVYGATTNGKKITLVNCQVVNSRFGAGVPTETLRPRVLVIGGHFVDFEEMRFTSMTVRFSNLEDWAAQSGITTTNPPTAAGPYEVSYTRPAPRSIRIPEGTVKLGFGWGSHRTLFRDATVTEHAALTFQRTKGFTFREGTRGFIWPIQNLLTLCTLETADVVDVRLRRRRSDHDSLQIIYQSSVEPPDREKPLLFSDMLLPAAVVRRELPTLVREWFRASDALRSVLGLYFAVMSGRWMFLESRFLNVAQAAEVFHRLTYPNRVLSKAQHRTRVREILRDVPEKHAAWLTSILSFSNEPRLGDRFSALVEDTSNVFDWREGEKSLLVAQATGTRHYLTHYDPRGAGRAVADEKLYWLSEMLVFLVGVLLLRHVRVPVRRVREGLYNNQRFTFARSRWRSLNSLETDA